MLIATAGHVDHGKTSLIRVLTGINTDRLDEERRRGLSIELGFAYKSFSENKRLGFIDVPGHHRFMNTMIAGVTGIDMAMLVVAADDGIMPQTLEHLQILKALGVEHYVAVISKIDRVDESRVENVAEQVRMLLPDAPICKTSTETGAGIDGLLDHLLGAQPMGETPDIRGHFRMYIDRSFTKKGSGLVVTGTVLSGSVTAGDELFLHQNSHDDIIAVKVRAIHAQGEMAAQGQAGQRCALNLTGKITSDNLERGNILYGGADVLPAIRIDGRFHPAETPSPESIQMRLKHMGYVKLYMGARRFRARAYLVNREDNTPSPIVQFILDAGVIAFAGDRFLVRDDSEHHILGGGIIIDPATAKWAKTRDDRIRRLQDMEGQGGEQAIAKLVFDKGEIVSLREHKRIWNMTDQEVEQVLSSDPFKPGNFMALSQKGDRLVVSAKQWKFYCDHLTKTLTNWHQKNPGKASIALDALKLLSEKLIPLLIISDVLKANISVGNFTQTDNQVRMSGHRPKLTLNSEKNWARLEALMQDRLPLRSEIEKELGFDPKQIEAVTRPRLKAGKLFEIGEKRLALPSTLHSLASKIEKHANGSAFTVIDAKQAFDLGRNQTIEILEFFDAVNYTVRVGDTRSILKPESLDIIFGPQTK